MCTQAIIVFVFSIMPETGSFAIPFGQLDLIVHVGCEHILCGAAAFFGVFLEILYSCFDSWNLHHTLTAFVELRHCDILCLATSSVTSTSTFAAVYACRWTVTEARGYAQQACRARGQAGGCQERFRAQGLGFHDVGFDCSNACIVCTRQRQCLRV